MNYKPIAEVNYLVVHSAATPADMDIDIEWIRDVHRRKGYFDVGYHFFIRRNGVIQRGRPLDRPGAHARGHNHESLGLCMAGGITDTKTYTPENNFTDAQFVSLTALLRWLSFEYPKAEVCGHGDLPKANTACPSFDVREWWASVPPLIFTD